MLGVSWYIVNLFSKGAIAFALPITHMPKPVTSLLQRLSFTPTHQIKCLILFEAMSGENRFPVFSVMAADWFCEKFGWIEKVEDVKPVL